MTRLFKQFILVIALVFSVSTVFASKDTTKIISTSREIQLHIDEDNVSKDIRNLTTKAEINGLVVTWTLDYSVLPLIKEKGYTLSLKYNTKLRADQEKEGYKNVDWTVIENISPDSTSYELKKLAGDENYVVKVGINDGNKTYWSEKAKGTTNQEWGIFKFLVLIGSLGIFIYGMKIMSEGLQQAAGSKLRNLLGSITSNRVKGVLTGFGITAIIQSSSVTTVMTVSFVNAGLMTLMQSAGVMMGANIGTTITGWLINFFGFKVDVAAYALVIIAFGAPMLFVGKARLKAWATAIIGFALLFMGLNFLKDAVPPLGADSALVQFFINYKDIPVLSTLMFVFLGTLVTIIIQSSSAAMALTMTLVASGILPFEVAAAMILGENIGTTITAELASTIGNVHAKRSARIHSLFNIIGVTWAVLAFPFMLKAIRWGMHASGLGDPFTDNELSANTGLAIFHSMFNLMNVLLLIWFVPQLVKLAERTVKSKGAADEEFHLDYIGTGIMATPDLSLLEAKKEIAKFGEITSRMSKFTRTLLFEKGNKKVVKLREKIAKYEEITDRVEFEVANYLNKISEGELSEQTAIRIRGMNSIVNDLERIGDIYYQMSKALERKDDEKAWFTPEQRNNLDEMFNLVDKAFTIMCENLVAHHDTVKIDTAIQAENAINTKRDELRKEYLDGLTDNTASNFRAGMIYSEMFSSLEKVGDHIINVTEAVVGKM